MRYWPHPQPSPPACTLPGAVRTGSGDVYGAVYGSADPPLVVVSNISPERRGTISWRVDLSKLGIGKPERAVVRDTATGTARTVPARALRNGGLTAELEGWEYRIFENRAAK